ncbi:hypothetical protein [Archangium sp.]|uniref:hypothetical protein n=1 Tax=Archangium sp. TaxID=1872627 RepID=UPI002D4D2F38|nr:hypothetical protein [Archangium sp.]HYO51270.1 hypothetical protein [Archangium sp.]
MRETAAGMLASVNGRLAPFDVELIVLDGYRSLACQQGLWAFFYDDAVARRRTGTRCFGGRWPRAMSPTVGSLSSEAPSGGFDSRRLQARQHAAQPPTTGGMNLTPGRIGVAVRCRRSDELRTLSMLSVVVVSGLWLAGCGPQDLDGDEVASQLEQDFGGPSGLMDFVESHSVEEIRRAMEPYGVGFVTPALITDCPQFFPSGDRNTWHTLNGKYHFIDSSGPEGCQTIRRRQFVGVLRALLQRQAAALIARAVRSVGTLVPGNRVHASLPAPPGSTVHSDSRALAGITCGRPQVMPLPTVGESSASGAPAPALPRKNKRPQVPKNLQPLKSGGGGNRSRYGRIRLHSGPEAHPPFSL